MRILEEIFCSGFGKIQLNNMKKLLVLIVFIAAGIIIFLDRSIKKRELDYKSKIDSLNTQIQLKEDSIIAFKEKVDIFVDRVNRAEVKLEENQNKIKKLYKEYEVHLLSIDSYDIDELESFFASRYKESDSTKY